MTNGDRFNQGVADQIDEIVQVAVEQGQAPGVVAAVARGDTVFITAAGAMAAGGR